MTVRVKVCGIRSAADLRAAEGADAVGFVVASPTSKRNLPPPVAARLAAQAPVFVQTVLVTRETHPARLAALQGAVPTDALQVHGLGSRREAREVRRAVHGKLILAAAPSAERPRLAEELAEHADALLLDSADRAGVTGGTGRTHDWRVSARVAREVGVPVVLAGGLTPANVGEAVRTVRPYGVDVSGGVEGARGKSRAKVRKFLEEARRA